jgi:hypothetical protein
MYDKLRTDLIAQSTQDKIDSIPPAQIVLTRIKNNQRLKIGIVSIATAACLIGGVSIISTLLNKGQRESIVFEQSKDVQLQIGSQTINLNGDSSIKTTNGISLNTANKALSYTSNSNSNQLSILKVPAGKDYTLILSDGSKVMLNSASEIEFPMNFTGNYREVTIKGEAYLDIKKVSNKPFIVHLAKGSIQVLGTAFNVNSYDIENIRISLVNGAVKFKSIVDSVILQSGEQASYGNDQVTVESFDEDDVLSWREGIYNFDNTPIVEIAKVFPRYFGISIVVDESAISKRFFGSLDRNKSYKQFLSNLKKTNDIDYYIKDEIIHLK